MKNSNVTGYRLQCDASALSHQFNVFLQIPSIVRAHIVDNQKMQSSKENLLKFNGHKIASHSRMRKISDQISWQFNDGKVGLSLIATNGYLFINKCVIKLTLQHNYVTSKPLMLYILNALIKFYQADKIIQIHCICL